MLSRVPRCLAVLIVSLAVTGGGCGSSDETETVTVPSSEADGTAIEETETQTSSLEPVASPITVEAVESCFDEGGADVQPGSNDLGGGGGKGVFAVGPQGGYMGVAIAPNAAVGKELVRQLAATGEYEVNRVASDPKVVVLFQGDVDAEDKALADQCVSGDREE